MIAVSELPVAGRLGAAMRNGARLEAAGIAAHRRLIEHAAPEFRERLHAALQDEERHTVMQRELAMRLWWRPLPTSEGVSLLGHQVVHVADPLWAMVALHLTEMVFEYRLRAIARRARQLGFRFLYDPLMAIAADEGRHVQLVRDMLRAEPAVSAGLIREVAAWIATNERADGSGLFPRDQLVPLMTERLLEEVV